MVTQHKIAVFRHLIGKGNAALPQGRFIHIGLRQYLTVPGDGAGFIYGNDVTGQADNPLEQQLVLPGKAHQITGFQVPCFPEQNHILILQGRRHAVAGYPKHRQKQGCRQSGRRGHNHQHTGGTGNGAPKPLPEG